MSQAALSYEETLKARYKAVGMRLRKDAANVNRKPKPAPVINVVDEKREWEAFSSAFDDHVIRHRANVGTKWYVRYAKDRAVELGFESFEALIAAGRSKHFSLGRQIIAYEIRQSQNTIGYPELGKLFGGQDHSTAINSVQSITRMGHDKAVATLAQIMEKLAQPKRHQGVKLTDEDVIEIRKLHQQLSRREICDIFDISTRTYTEIVTGQSWKHLL